MMSVVSSDVPQSIFPLSVERPRRGALAVHPDEADDAQRIIDEPPHRVDQNGQVVRLRDEFEALQQAIGYRFRDRGLLEHAMTHTSRANEDVSGGVVDNESMEFLGDAVLGFVVADMLFREFPEYDEGQKSKIKAAVVSTATLARQAERLQLGDHLLLGRGEEKTGGRRKQALLADGYEALIAAIYLDGGIEHGAGVHRPRVRAAARRRRARRRHRAGLQVGAAGAAAGARPAAARVPARRRRSARITASSSGRSGRRGEALGDGDGREQEGSGAGSGAGGIREATRLARSAAAPADGAARTAAGSANAAWMSHPAGGTTPSCDSGIWVPAAYAFQ